MYSLKALFYTHLNFFYLKSNPFVQIKLLIYTYMVHFSIVKFMDATLKETISN